MRVAIFAYHDIGYECLDFLIQSGAEIVAVTTHEDDPEEEIWFRSVAELSRRHGLPVYTPDHPNTPDFIEIIRRAAPELIFSFYYRRLLSAELLAFAPCGALNLHGSLLPRYRGRAPVNWVLVNGETETGVTLHHMIEKADAGDIVAQKRVPIDFEDTALTLYRKLTRAARALMEETYPVIINGTAPRIPQDDRVASKFRGRRPADGKIDWGLPAVAIYNLVRAVTHPYPGAFTFYRGQKLFIWQAAVDEITATADPGAILAIDPSGIRVAAADGILIIKRLQLDGAPELPAIDFADQYQLHTGDRLGTL
jgi:methionyl-tRNA formyltransferase